MAKRVFIAILLLLIIFGSLFVYDVWRNYQSEQTAKMFRPPPITVSTIKAEKQQWRITIPAVGSLVAKNSVDVTPDIEGKVIDIFFTSGQQVKKGEILIQLDDEILQQTLKDQTAQLMLNKDNFERSKRLYQRGAVPKSNLDLNESLFIRSQANVASSKINIKYKKVKAPFDGRLGIRKVNIGDFIEPGDPIVSLDSLDPMFVDFTIPEKYVSKLKIGQQITVTVDAYPGQKFTGTLIAINSMVDEGTRNMTIRGKISNADGKLYPGMFANIELTTDEQRDAVVVPRNAITYSTFGDVVYKIKKEKGKLIAKQNTVRVGEQRGDWIAVNQGIEPGDEIVTAGQVKLRPNSQVVIDNSNPLKIEKSK